MDVHFRGYAIDIRCHFRDTMSGACTGTRGGVWQGCGKSHRRHTHVRLFHQSPSCIRSRGAFVPNQWRLDWGEIPMSRLGCAHSVGSANVRSCIFVLICEWPQLEGEAKSQMQHSAMSESCCVSTESYLSSHFRKKLHANSQSYVRLSLRCEWTNHRKSFKVVPYQVWTNHNESYEVASILGMNQSQWVF